MYVFISSPEPKAAYRIPMDPVSVVIRPAIHIPLKPLGQSEPNFMWSRLGKGVQVT